MDTSKKTNRLIAVTEPEMNGNGVRMDGNRRRDYPHAELTSKIVGAAMKIMNSLGPGLSEKCYENALVIELRTCGHRVDQQHRFPVKYEGHLVGTLIPDLLVDELVIVDPKVVDGIGNEHIAQMLTYLSVSELDLALLINFRRARLEWKRVVP